MPANKYDPMLFLSEANQLSEKATTLLIEDNFEEANNVLMKSNNMVMKVLYDIKNPDENFVFYNKEVIPQLTDNIVKTLLELALQLLGENTECLSKMAVLEHDPEKSIKYFDAFIKYYSKNAKLQDTCNIYFIYAQCLYSFYALYYENGYSSECIKAIKQYLPTISKSLGLGLKPKKLIELQLTDIFDYYYYYLDDNIEKNPSVGVEALKLLAKSAKLISETDDSEAFLMLMPFAVDLLSMYGISYLELITKEDKPYILACLDYLCQCMPLLDDKLEDDLEVIENYFIVIESYSDQFDNDIETLTDFYNANLAISNAREKVGDYYTAYYAIQLIIELIEYYSGFYSKYRLLRMNNRRNELSKNTIIKKRKLLGYYEKTLKLVESITSQDLLNEGICDSTQEALEEINLVRAETYNILAICYAELNDLDNAVEFFNKAKENIDQVSKDYEPTLASAVRDQIREMENYLNSKNKI